MTRPPSLCGGDKKVSSENHTITSREKTLWDQCMNTLLCIIGKRSYQVKKKKREKITYSLIADLRGSDTDSWMCPFWVEPDYSPPRERSDECHNGWVVGLGMWTGGVKDIKCDLNLWHTKNNDSKRCLMASCFYEELSFPELDSLWVGFPLEFQTLSIYQGTLWYTAALGLTCSDFVPGSWWNS